MFCECNNLLKKIECNGKLMVVCLACGFSEEIGQNHSMIYHSDDKKIVLPINGSTIYNYESNPKIFKTCPQCFSAIVSHKKYTKFGCRCGYAWIEEINIQG